MKKTTPARKKRLYNIIMVVAIVAIFAASVMAVGSLQGWFGENNSRTTAASENGEVFTAQNKMGGVNLERAGIAYALDNGNGLRDGDVIETLPGASINLIWGNNAITVGQNSELTVHIDDSGAVSAEFARGEAFFNLKNAFSLRVMNTELIAEDAVFGVSAPSGSANIFVFENKVKVGENEIEAGSFADIFTEGVHKGTLSIGSLDDFFLGNIKEANNSRILCFTNAQIEELISQRAAQISAAAQAQQLEKKPEQQIEEQRQNESEKTDGSQNTKQGTSSSDAQASPSAGTAQPGGTQSGSGGVSASDTPKCTIEIRCDTILNNLEDLVEGKNKFVPSNGCILATSSLEFTEGETVFDILKRACTLAGIQLEYSWTPMYNSYYIEGINNLYEFDCGEESGWMYQVNGWFPNYGCSGYTLQDGDVIVWRYTCKGLGADVGGSVG
ncbi:MAG: DUF4430 domain-containing protein [Christensenella sp.]|nr:DUF4430 domain-containing protein [Christensenella sp.]